MAVLAIALMALVVAGGISYLKPDFAVRSETADRVTASYRSLESAVAAYRLSNGGALPSGSSWKSDLAPYFPGARASVDDTLRAPKSMEWSFARSGSAVSICLSGSPISKAQHEGLALAKERSSLATLAKSCTGSADASFDGTAALRFELQSGG